MVEARFGQRGYGSVRIEISEKIPCQVNLNGHLKHLNNPAIREGIYEGRLRNIRYMRSHLFYLHVSLTERLSVRFKWVPIKEKAGLTDIRTKNTTNGGGVWRRVSSKNNNNIQISNFFPHYNVVNQTRHL
jgi:hypothetical protein